MIRLVPGPEETPPRSARALPEVDVVVPAAGPWHALRPCLESVDAFTRPAGAAGATGVRLLVAGGAPEGACEERLAAFCERAEGLPKRRLPGPPEESGVERANRGLAEASAPFVALLRGDCVVAPGWLTPLLETALSDPRAACALPLSNRNPGPRVELPMGWNAFQFAADLARRESREGFEARPVGGACLLLRKEALEDVGLPDAELPGTDLAWADWCLRARSRGWRLLGSPRSWVHRRPPLAAARAARDGEALHGALLERWGDVWQRALAESGEDDALADLRRRSVCLAGAGSPPLVRAFADRLRSGGWLFAASETARYLRGRGGLRGVPALLRTRRPGRRSDGARPAPRGFQSARRPRVVYVLEKFSVSGGVLSVVQLVNRLTLLGWDAKIATHHGCDQRGVADYCLYHQPYVFPDADALVRDFPEADVVVATLWSTAARVRRVLQERLPRAVPWYFVQDDEVRFFPEWDREGRRRVVESYAWIPHRIVKSEWLRGALRARGHDSHLVPIGLDLDLFHPERPVRDRPARVIAMARPDTPRRGFPALVEALGRVRRARPDVEIALFGCPDLAQRGLDFPVEDLGVVSGDELRGHYSRSAVALDLSAFQGLGRLGLEAMACGSAAVLTRVGGIGEYARDGENCRSVDPARPEQAARAVLELLEDEEQRYRLAEGGLATARRFDCGREARATSRLFAASLGLEEDVSGGARPAPPQERKPGEGRASD